MSISPLFNHPNNRIEMKKEIEERTCQDECNQCGEWLEDCTCVQQYECPFCGTDDDNDHLIKCPNNNDPFAFLVNNGYD